MVLKHQSVAEPFKCERLFQNVKNVYWMTQYNITTNDQSWSPDTSTDWDPQPTCHATFQGGETCHKRAEYILYKTPEHVSIRSEPSPASAVEGTKLQLHCEIFGVAPARNLTVRWWMLYKNGTHIEYVGENDTCSFDLVRSPVNVSCTTALTLNKTHNGMTVQCEAQLNVGTDPPMNSSLLIDVLYEPIINTTKLPKKVPVFRGYYEELVCEADGNPAPNITWHFSSNTARLKPNNTLIVSEAGFYNCTASNFNTTKHVVTVNLEEDYLPLIAGFVAVVVVAISVIFLFIYSIYYKNTKMRRYNLKNPKLSTHNGNVAHNGWDLPLPMTKLS